jgi:hypothetical protein
MITAFLKKMFWVVFFGLGFEVFAGCVSTRLLAFFCVFVRCSAFIRVSLRLLTLKYKC